MSEGIDFSVFDNAVKPPKKQVDFSSFDNTIKKKVETNPSNNGSEIPIVPLDKQGLETPSIKLDRENFSNYILNPASTIKAEPKPTIQSLNKIEKQQFVDQNGYFKPQKEQEDILAGIVAQRNNPVVQYNNGKTFLEKDIDTHTNLDNFSNYVLNPASINQKTPEDIKKDILDEGDAEVDGKIPSIAYANARKAQIDQQIADLKNAQYTGRQRETGRPIMAANFDELQGKIDELTSYKNDLTNFTDPVAKVQVFRATKDTPPDPNNPASQIYNHWGDVVGTRTPEESKYMNVGMNYTSLYDPITVENKKKSLESGGDKTRNGDLVSIENYGYEKQGIITSIEALDILHSQGKVDPQNYEAERGKLLQSYNGLLAKYPVVRMQNVKGALGQILDENRGVVNSATGQTGAMKSLYENIIHTGYSDDEVNAAIKQLNAKGANITKQEAEFLINNKSDIGNTSLLGRAIGGTVNLENKLEATAGLQTDTQYENTKHLLEQRFANTPNKATEQPQTIISTEGTVESNPDFLQPVKNPDAGLHNWGWGTVNLVADGVGTLAKLYALTELTGGLADELVGSAVGTEVIGATESATLGKIIQQTALSASQRQTIGTIAGMYLDTYQDAKDAAKTFIGDEQGGDAAREMYANLMGLANGIAWTILPANKIVQDITSKAATVGAEDFAKLIPKEGIEGLKENMVADFLKNTLVNTAKAQGKITGIGALTQVSLYAAQAMYNPQSVESRNLGQEITDGALQGLSFLPITLLEGRGIAKNIEKVNDFQKEAIYRVSADPVAFKNFTENEVRNGNMTQPEANAKIQLVNTMFEIRSKEVPDDLTKPEKIEYANNLLYTKKLHQENETIKDPVQTKKNDEKIAELEKRRQEILDNSTGKIPAKEEIKNTPVAEPEKIDEVALVNEAKDLVNNDVVKGYSADPLKEAANNDPEGFKKYLKNIAEQANDPKSNETTIDTYGKELVDISQKLFPDENISSSKTNNNENKVNEDNELQGVGQQGQHNGSPESGQVQSDNAQERQSQGKEVVNSTASDNTGAVPTTKPTDVQKPVVTVPIKLDGKGIDAKYLDEYKGHKIVEIDGDVYTYDPKNEVLFKVALDDSKATGNKKVIPEANNVETAKQYIDWKEGANKENKFVPIPIKPTDVVGSEGNVNRLIFDRESGQPLDGIDEQMAEKLIDKAISKSKTTDEANGKLDELGYNLRSQANADFNEFVQDRIDGKTDMTFSEWKNGKQKSENKPIVNEQEAKATEIPNTEKETGTTNEPPPENIKPAEEGTGEGDKKGAGLAQTVQEKRRDILGATPYEKGKGWNKEEALARGKELADNGMNVEDIFKRFAEDNRVSGDEMARLQYESVQLAKETQKAADKFGEDSPEYKEALKNENEFLDRVQPLKTESSKTFTAQQGEVDLDTGSFNAVKKATQKINGDAPVSKEQEAKIKELTEHNQKLQKKSDELEKQVIELTDKELGKPKKEKGRFEKKATELSKKIMEADLPSWLKIDDPNASTKGMGAEDLKKLLSDATINMGRLLDKGADFAEAVKEAVNDLVKLLGEDKRNEIEKGFTEHYNSLINDTPEGKELQKLRNRKEKLEIGNLDKKDKTKLNFTDKQKQEYDQLKKDIKDLEETLGINQKVKPVSSGVSKDEGIQKAYDIASSLLNKKGNKFTPQESKDIWDYAKSEYLDKGVSYRDMIKGVAADLGLSWKQVSEGITSKKTKPISDAMWKKQGELRRAQNVTKMWIDAQSRSIYVRAFLKASAAIRGLQVFGHAGVFMGTHAGMTLAQPRTWKHTIPAFFRAYKFAYGNDAAYERSLEELKSRPLYTRFERLGLKNNPDQVNAEEFQKSQTALGGWLKKIGLQGIKGFNALKVLRQDLAEYHYNKLSESEKLDDGAVRSIVKLVNNATGATNLKLPEIVNEVTFAGGMEAARWGKLTRNPMRATAIALKALIHPEKATVEEKVFAKVWASRVGEQLATYTSLIFANAAIQSVVNPNNPTNIFNPNKKDWLRPKFGSLTIDPTSGMMSTVDFIKTLGKIPFEDKKQLRGDTKTQAYGKAVIGRLRGKLAPAYSFIWDMITQTDYNGNQLPLSNIKPDASHRNIGWLEFAAQRLPIPVAEGLHEMFQSAAENGSSPTETSNVLQALLLAGISGTTGARANETTPERPTPYTNEDKKDPTFKYFLDKGLELPNTAASSEEVTDEKNMTKKKLSDFPKEMQDEYSDKHKEILKNELEEIQTKDVVYVREYMTSSGDLKSVVSLDEKPNSEKKSLDELTKEELEQVLHISQSKATKKAKKEVFNDNN